MNDRREPALLRGVGRNVIILGVVSLLTDVSSEMLYPVVPLFLTAVLHAPMTVVGLVEGVAESTASLLKILSGWWSDRVGRRGPFVVWGYSLSAVSKPLLALAGTWHLVLFSRLVDRTGKGLRTSPRDALIAASCAPEVRGKAYGLHRAMDTVGAVLGPLLALWLLSRLGVGYRTIFLLAFVPAALGVACLGFLQRGPVEAVAPAAGRRAGTPLSPGLRRLVWVYAVFALGNSSDVFLLLKARETGFTPEGVLLTYVFYNFVYALAATPAGWLSDRFSRRVLLAGGWLVFALVYVGFALAPGKGIVWFLFALYGFYGAATEGVAKAYVADLSVAGNRGTAMGLLHTVTGILAFVASVVAGALWSRIGPSAPFVYGAACALVSAGLLLTVLRPRPGDRRPGDGSTIAG